MPKKPVLGERSGHTWKNWHATTGVGGSADRFYSPRNLWDDGTRHFWKPGLAGLVEIVKRAEDAHLRVRALGSGWSLSNVGYVNQVLVNTQRLSNFDVGFTQDRYVAPDFRPIKNRLVFAQCGVQIRTLNEALLHAAPERLALPTSGASNGQTIVGATQTGTHGSAHGYGPMSKCIRALHIVAEGGKHWLIQPDNEPAITEDFARLLKAELLEDKDLFKAAVVGIGSFGVVHAVVLEAEPLYGLRREVTQLDFDDVESVIHDFDPTPLGRDALPFHLEVVVNPYLRGRGEQGAFVRIYDRFPIPKGASVPRIPADDGGLRNSEDLVAIGGMLSDTVPSVIPGILQSELKNSLRPTLGAPVEGTPGAQFFDTQPTEGGTSAEIAVALDDAKATADAIWAVCDRHTFGAPVAFRWTKSVPHYFASSRFSPVTCHIEMPGIDTGRTREGFEMIWRDLRLARIPYVCHWGQALPVGRSWVRSGFGSRRVNDWLGARRRFLPGTGRTTFSNEILSRYDLD